MTTVDIFTSGFVNTEHINCGVISFDLILNSLTQLLVIFLFTV